MAVTPYLRLAKPPFDSIPWDVAINGNMDIIDGYIAQYMSIANFVGAWYNNAVYVAGVIVLDTTSVTLWQCNVSHTSAAAPATFAQDRTAHPTYWANVTTAPPPQITGNIGRNLLHNPLFNIQQRGSGPWNTNGLLTVDRWAMGVLAADTLSVQPAPLADPARLQIGDEAAVQSLQANFVGSSSGLSILYQRIEDVRRLSGKTVTVTFWAAASAGTPSIGMSLDQNFGTGGSPSAVAGGNGVSMPISTAWVRYGAVFNIPSAAGKTLGSNGDHYTQLNLWLSASPSHLNNAGIGVQTAIIQFWGVQLEMGGVATPLDKPDPRYDRSNCQRFFWAGALQVYGFGATAGAPVSSMFAMPTSLRTTPILQPTWTTQTNVTSPTTAVLSTSTGIAYGTATATGTFNLVGTFTASADL